VAASADGPNPDGAEGTHPDDADRGV